MSKQSKKKKYSICNKYSEWEKHVEVACRMNILNYKDFLHWLYKERNTSKLYLESVKMILIPIYISLISVLNIFYDNIKGKEIVFIVIVLLIALFSTWYLNNAMIKVDFFDELIMIAENEYENRFRGNIKINTDRLVLKPLGMEYFDTVCKYSMDVENTRYMVHLPKSSCEEVQEFLVNVDLEWKKRQPSYYEFAILLNNIHIGAVSIYFDNYFECGKVGWIIDKEYWGNGYAFEASKALIDTCRNEMNITKVIAHCDSENGASMKVMQKLGMRFVRKQKGRKNRASEEMREECIYELFF